MCKINVVEYTSLHIKNYIKIFWFGFEIYNIGELKSIPQEEG